MTRIAIYGDSYASCLHGWPKYFQAFYKKSEIETFGLGGSSPNYSYMKFIETHEKYDMVIFLWTSITRNCLIARDYKRKKYEIHGFTENYCLSEELKEDIKQNLRKNVLYNIETKQHNVKGFSKVDKDWIIYESILSTKYPSKNFLENIAMRDSVKLRRPDSINIECFYNYQSQRYGIMSICAADFFSVLKDRPDFNSLRYCDDAKIRPNHLSLTQNKEFAKYLYRHINESNFDIHDTFEEPEKYYTMSKTFDGSGFIV
jgi:hypothetical protein